MLINEKALFAALLIAATASPAIAKIDYGSQHIYSSTDLVWGFLKKPQRNKPVGFACIIDDRLAGMVRQATISRYAIIAIDRSADLDFAPLGAIAITRSGTRKLDIDPDPGKTYRKALEFDDFNWYKSEGTPNAIGKACVDGGLSAAEAQVKKLHGIR